MCDRHISIIGRPKSGCSPVPARCHAEAACESPPKGVRALKAHGSSNTFNATTRRRQVAPRFAQTLLFDKIGRRALKCALKKPAKVSWAKTDSFRQGFD